MTRTKAALLHLVVSALVVGSVLALVFLAWYPDYLFALSGAIGPILVMVGVDVTLGPLLTLVVFKPGKPGLKFDLAAIFTVQAVALLYASFTLFTARPYFLVFAEDSYAAVAAVAVDMSALDFDELDPKPLIGPVKVFAELPQEAAARQAFLDAVLFDGEPDLQYRSELYRPYSDGAAKIRAAARRIEDFVAANTNEEQEIASAMKRFGEDHPALGIVPTLSIVDDFALVIDLDSLEPLAAIRVNAWQQTEQAEITETN